jgi:hypothetical protein
LTEQRVLAHEPEVSSAEMARVLAWREEQFLDMRFSPQHALALSLSHADLHEAAALIRDGCPPEIAYDILVD